MPYERLFAVAPDARALTMLRQEKLRIAAGESDKASIDRTVRAGHAYGSLDWYVRLPA